MSIKKELNFVRLEHLTTKKIYIISDIIFLLGHITYLFVFQLFDIAPMKFYNFFSVAFYAVMIIFLQKFKNPNVLVMIAFVEIAVHSTLGVYYMGWYVGFAQFLLFIVPIPFSLNFRRKICPYIVSILDILLFCSLKIFSLSHNAPYIFTNERVTVFFYLLNSIFGACVILYLSSIYMFQREINKRKQKEKNEALKKLATIDPLTQLFNRRAMNDFLKMIVNKSNQTGKSYIIGLTDIDDFKKTNDTYGHEVGDKVLQKVAKTIVENVPSEGYVCRWGGEEVLFAIPSTDLNDGAKCGENIRSAIERLPFYSNDGTKFGVTITIGIYESEPGGGIEKAIHEADSNLYYGKRHGKNCVIS